MINLFAKDKSKELKQAQENLKKYYLLRYKNETEVKKDIQQDINRCRSLEMYQNLRSANENTSEIYNKINILYEKYKNKLDTDELSFIKDFPRECWQGCFELAIADLISPIFKLRSRNDCYNEGEPDLLFEIDGKICFVECVTRVSSRLDEYDKVLPEFDAYFSAVKIFFEKFELLKKEDSSWENYDWYFEGCIQQLWYCFRDQCKKDINHKLGFQDEVDDKKVIEKINFWIYWNKYAFFHFKEILPPSILDKMKEIRLSTNVISNKDGGMEFMGKVVAKAICDKLEKNYFAKYDMGIIAVSLAILVPGLNITSIESFLDYLRENLQSLMSSEIRKNPSKLKNDALKKLHSVIIDTQWYNWFSDIIGEWSYAPRNCYGVIYNSNFSKSDKLDFNIFDSCIYAKNAVELEEDFELT